MLAALPDFVLGLAFVALLVVPDSISASRAELLRRGALLEFVVIHCSALMIVPPALFAELRWRVLATAGIAAIYASLLTVFGLATGQWWAFAIFWPLLLNRSAGAMLGGAAKDEALEAAAHRWFGALTIYVCCLVPGLVRPPLGAALYYLLCGLSDLTEWSWFRRWQARQRARSR